MQTSDIIRIFGQNKLYSEVAPCYAAVSLGQMTGFVMKTSSSGKFLTRATELPLLLTFVWLMSIGYL